MEAFELILLMLAAVLLSAVIDQIVPKVSSPLIQIALGLLIALFAFSPIQIQIDPDLFIVLFIAPLLFYEAKKANKTALWKNRKPVLSLAIGLVFATALIIGFYVNWLIPSIPLAAALALGAALGPTDAVAVASLSKEVNLSVRQKALLEGESLINDASGIVSFQFAIAAVATGAFSLVDASIEFIISFFGGIAIGLILGFVANFVTKKIRSLGLDNTTFHVLLEIFMPFIVYLLAHSLGASGILAVVAAGLVIAISPKEIRPSVSRVNIVSNSAWQVLSFTLNGLVFVLLGAQLPGAMKATWESTQTSNIVLMEEIAIITGILMLARFLWVLAMDFVGIHRREHRKIHKADVKAALVTTLAGPKGAFTLSLVMTIPFFIVTSSGTIPFPERSLILFLASGVIIVTLLLATFVVPLLAPKKTGADDSEEDEAAMTIEILRNVIESLAEQQTPETRTATQAVIHSYNSRISRIKNSNDIDDSPNKELRIKVLRWEQDFILDLIEKNEIDSVDGYQFLNRLAHVQNLIKHRNDNSWITRNAARHIAQIFKSAIRSIKWLFPRNKATHESELRDLQIRSVEYAVKKLRAEMSNPDAPTEDVSALLLEYQRMLSRLRNVRPDMTAITKNVANVADIGRLGLNLELEQIQAMYEADRISRATSKKMRENVHLMQIDLEQNF